MSERIEKLRNLASELDTLDASERMHVLTHTKFGQYIQHLQGTLAKKSKALDILVGNDTSLFTKEEWMIIFHAVKMKENLSGDYELELRHELSIIRSKLVEILKRIDLKAI